MQTQTATRERAGEVLDDFDPETENVSLDLARRLRNPQVPATLNELAALEGQAMQVLDARIRILETARLQGIKMTHPEDWVLFKAPDGRVTGYLQDAGCDRIRDILGIEVFNVSEPQKLMAQDGQSFHYIVTGNGRSKLTMQVVEAVDGGRSSTDDFCRGETGIALDLKVRKAARANLNGRIVRELAGLKVVPQEELERAWQGTTKKLDHCRLGRGFGTKQERHGGDNPDAPKNVVPPTCGVCGATAVRRTSARGAFYGCPQFKKHEDRRWSIDEDTWLNDPRSKASEPAPAGDAPQGKE